MRNAYNNHVEAAFRFIHSDNLILVWRRVTYINEKSQIDICNWIWVYVHATRWTMNHVCTLTVDPAMQNLCQED